MRTNEIRQKYLDYFRQNGHTVCSSDVLVPKWDDTVLFTPAGMNPFKDHFLGKVELEFTRAASCQKCLRTGDIENVGRTAYHHTFFEMLGNFSFGDYFKTEAIMWAWEFLTDPKWMGIDPDRLTVSVYKDDHEAAEIWHNLVGVADDRIARLDEHDNFWPAGAPSNGPDGVCGPCSEIFFHPDNGNECEIWNLVFTQFNRSGDPPDNLHPLPSKNIDTGMGLERMAAVMQGVDTNFHIDSLLPLVEASADVCSTNYDPATEDGRRLRRIADHVRACVMAIHENVYPGTQKENYTVRRLLRRAVLQGHEMGARDPFLYQLVPTVVDLMKEPYPELTTTADNVSQVIKGEEESFLNTLDSGLARIEDIFAGMQSSGSRVVDGHAAFDLYQEQGIPAELFESIADERGYGFDWEGYEEANRTHKCRSGAGRKGVMGDFGPIDDIKREVKSTEFVGYACTSEQSVVRGLVYEVQETLVEDDDDGNPVETTRTVQHATDSLVPNEDQKQLLVLDRTPFYAEAGGQVGDTGRIVGPAGEFAVSDVQKNGDVYVHSGRVTTGTISSGEQVAVEVDVQRRNGIQRAHSATHILHYALQKFVGEHAQQRGSKVQDDQLRFDFANQEAVTIGQLQQIENESNRRVEEAAEVTAKILPMDEARAKGAMMLFGEKYPDPVRMVSIGDYSKELCGGTHVANTSDIGPFEIIGEELISAGTRRITALTGEKARQHAEQINSAINRLEELLQVPPAGLVEATKQLAKYARDLKKQLARGNRDLPPRSEPALADAEQQDADYMARRDILQQVALVFNAPLSQVVSRVAGLQDEIEQLTLQIEQLADTEEISADELWSRVIQLGDINLVVCETPAANPNSMRGLIDQLRKKHPSCAVFLASIQGADKVILVAGLSKDLVERGLSAGDWVKNVAPVVGGGGGGKPDMAQAGGKQPDKINVALDAAREYLRTATVT